MFGKLGNKSGVHAETGKRDGDIRLTPAVSRAISASLNKTVIALRRKTEHYLAKRNYFSHSPILSLYYE
jgi:hypothetical protein